MKSLLRVVGALILLLLVSSEAFSLATGSRNIVLAILDPRCVPFGGLGVFADHDYIDTRADKNVILYDDGKLVRKWTGENWNVPQSVVVWRGEVFDIQTPPPGFSRNESTIVSFKPDRVDFKNYPSGTSCYYDRAAVEQTSSEQAQGLNR